MPVSGGGMGKGTPTGVWSGDVISGGVGEGPGATKGSKQKAIKPKMLRGNLSYQALVQMQKQTMGKTQTFMPTIFVDAKKHNNKRG